MHSGSRNMLIGIAIGGCLVAGGSWLYITRPSGLTEPPTAYELSQAKAAREARELADQQALEAKRGEYIQQSKAILESADRLLREQQFHEAIALLSEWEQAGDAELRGRLRFARGQIPSEPSPALAREPPSKPEAAPPKALPCRQDPACWANEHKSEMLSSCRIAVEDSAKWDFEWTDAWYESKFGDIYTVDPAAGTLGAVGDKIRMQNGFGAWRNVAYLCIFDPTKRSARIIIRD